MSSASFETITASVPVSAEIGNISAEFLLPEKPAFITTFAHGAGAGMNHSFMLAMANELAQRNIGTLRFNFPFMENKKKRPDLPAVAHKTIEAAIQLTKEKFSKSRLFVSGKSFGGRMTSQLLSRNPDTAVSGIIFFGFPLHPAGKPSVDRADHLKQIDRPMLFLQGTKDELANWELIESVCSNLTTATLVKIEGADHSFKAGKQNVLPLLADIVRDWMQQQ